MRADAAARVVILRDAEGEPVAIADAEKVCFAPAVEALETDHPRRRFAAMLALVAGLMQTGPDAEPYDAARAAFYARFILIPDTSFILHAPVESNAELAERFNVPLDQIAAKRGDIFDVEGAVA